MSDAICRESVGMPTYGIDRDYPIMWAASKAVDDAERGGQAFLVGPMHREMAEAARELWDARRFASEKGETWMEKP